MKISVENPAFLFALFYIISWAVVFILILVLSFRKRIPLRSVLLMLTFTSILTVIGSRVICIPFSEWKNISSIDSLSLYENRSAIGGLISGLAGFIFAKRFFRLGREITDLYAWIAPLGFGIQKIGCFFNGCCFGRPTNLPWGVSFQYGSSAHYHQLINGLIPENATWSLSVHPVQLYETALFFLISFLAWKAIMRWKRDYSSLIFSLALFFLFRFIAEFLRDPSGSSFSNASFAGLRYLQWFLLLASSVCFVSLLIAENVKKKITEKIPGENGLELIRLMTFVAAVCFIMYLFSHFFSPYESISIYIKFIPAIILTGYYFVKSLKELRLRILTVSFLAFPLLVSTQALLQDSAKTKGSLKSLYENKINSYRRIDLAVSGGSAYNILKYNPHQGECGTTYTEQDYRHQFISGGGGYAAVRKDGKKVITRGINIYAGTDRESNLTLNTEKLYVIGGANPYIRVDFPWIGIGGGLHVGSLRWIPSRPLNDFAPSSGTRWSPVLPEIYFRVGQTSKFDVRYTYGYKFPATVPVMNSELSAGTGFGFSSNFNLRYGLDITKEQVNSFIYGEALITKNVGFMFKYSFGDKNLYNSNTGLYLASPVQRLVFGLNYRFGFNTVKELSFIR